MSSTPAPIDTDEAEIVIGPREQLFHLLAEASEIEHTLMCSYLYAAFSLKKPGHPDFSPEEADAVGRWRKAIMDVATEEMAHLLLVANLSVALGGRPHFDRPNFPVAPGYFPSGVVVKLTPFSMDTLQHFIFLERPAGATHEDGAGFEPEQTVDREEAFHGLMPSVQNYRTVGALYEALAANLRTSSARLGERALFIGSRAAQVGPEVVSFEHVGVIDSLAAALDAIDHIVEQGEGAPGERDDSHYQRFLAIRTEYEQLLARNPKFAPAWPAATSPVMRRPPEPEDKVFVDSPKAARLLDFTNAVYSVLLRCLVQTFGREGANAAPEQGRYFEIAIELMHMLAAGASALVELPASARHSGVTAGMSFTMLRGVEPFLQGPAERVLLRERLTELRDGALNLRLSAPTLVPLAERIDGLIRRQLGAEAAHRIDAQTGHDR
ncbi:MAG TPA: ferritin-like protein [Steroidobacteraceae bacterium]|nr:ferritin-like protein [Steroidobacteraceae bacterium]